MNPGHQPGQSTGFQEANPRSGPTKATAEVAVQPLDPVAGALRNELLRNARLINLVRCTATTLFVALSSWSHFFFANPMAEPFSSLLGGYWLFGLVVFFVCRRSERLALLSRFIIPVADMPLVFCIQFDGFSRSANPAAVSAFTIGIFICLVMMAAMSLARWQIYASGLIAISLQLLLQHYAADTWNGRIAGMLLIGVAAAICDLARQRRIELTALMCREQLRRERLGRYFSPQIAAHIEQQADHLAAGQQCEVSVLFGDIRDFTSLAEQLDTRQLMELLNDFQARMVQVVFDHGGTFDKYIGDGLMAYFGAPLPQPDHARRAAQCAVAMFEQLEQMNQERSGRNQPPIRMGIGIHTGPALVGSIGAPHRREFTAIGDTVNLASRLEELTKKIGEAIIVSETTRSQAGEGFRFRTLEAVQVRGRRAAIQTHALSPSDP